MNLELNDIYELENQLNRERLDLTKKARLSHYGSIEELMQWHDNNTKLNLLKEIKTRLINKCKGEKDVA